MKIEIDLVVTPRTKRAIKWLVLPFAVLGGSAAVAHATLSGDQPVAYASVASGQPIKAANVKALLDDLDARLGTVEARTQTLALSTSNTSICSSGLCSGVVQQPAGWVASVTNTGAGTWSVAYKTPFKSAPICTASLNDFLGGGTTQVTCMAASGSTDSISVECRQGTSNVNAAFTIVCVVQP
jgi:hypothetical protein